MVSQEMDWFLVSQENGFGFSILDWFFGYRFGFINIG